MSETRSPLLEVIALDVTDAVIAERGGADRLELVRKIALAGLTPARDDFARIRDAVTLPLRVMLRTNGGFLIDAAELDTLCREAEELRRAGADQFVLGFLTPSGDLDLAAIAALQAIIAPCPWTLHHAFDHATDQRQAWTQATQLSGADHVLSGGRQGDLGRNLATLVEHAGWQSARLRWLAGGQLQLEHIPPLRACGITSFHAGRAARTEARWDRPVDEQAVRLLRQAVDRPVAAAQGD